MNVRSIALVALTLLLLTVVLLADGQVPEEKLSKELIGTWKLVSGKYGGRTAILSSRVIILKHITPTHHTWMHIDSESGEVTNMAGGKWSLKGDQFSTTPTYGMGSRFSGLKGNMHTYTCKIIGDRWYFAGKLQESGLTIDEVWERQRPDESESKDG